MEILIDKKTRALFYTMMFFLLFAVVVLFFKFNKDKDFVSYLETNCDSKSEMCFYKECDFENDVRCEGKDTFVYKIVFLKNDKIQSEFQCSKENINNFNLDIEKCYENK